MAEHIIDKIKYDDEIYNFQDNISGYITREDLPDTSNFMIKGTDDITSAQLVSGTIQSADGTTFYLNLDANLLQMSSYYTKEEANAQINDAIGRFIRIQDGKVYIGLESNNIQLVESNDKIAFVDKASGAEVAYIFNNRCYIPNLAVLETADFGGYQMDVSNGISFKWIGRE